MPTSRPTQALPLPAASEGPEHYRLLLATRGLCDPALPAVTVELYGNLRIRTGCAELPLHARTIRQALEIACRVLPQAERLLKKPEEIPRHFRFSVNGGDVTTDLDCELRNGDRLLLFSASVGG